jgi:hydroxymethylbilane synthase
MTTWTIATRQSPLALWQANYVSQLIKALDPSYTVELLPMVTTGDIAGPKKWLMQSGKGMFVKELEEALLSKRADIAVHSMKDLPAHFPAGLGLAAICERANPFDAFVSSKYLTFNELPLGAKVGTASLRRQSQLLNHRPDLNIHPLRGNVQTRLQKMQDEQFDAIILAVAGLERLDLNTLIKEELTPPLMLPACGQGAIGIECRQDDHALIEILQKINCATTALCVNTERMVNAKLGGSCHTPIAIYCTAPTPEQLSLQVRILNADGTQCIEAQGHSKWEEASQLAEQCAEALMQQNALTLIST